MSPYSPKLINHSLFKGVEHVLMMSCVIWMGCLRRLRNLAEKLSPAPLLFGDSDNRTFILALFKLNTPPMQICFSLNPSCLLSPTVTLDRYSIISISMWFLHTILPPAEPGIPGSSWCAKPRYVCAFCLRVGALIPNSAGLETTGSEKQSFTWKPWPNVCLLKRFYFFWDTGNWIY